MALKFRTHGIWPAVAAAGVLALSGCSQDDGDSAASAASDDGEPSGTASTNGELAIPFNADEETKKLYVQENALAACMRAKGFTYTPHVRMDDNALVPVDGEDYDAAKKFREKYGFGLYAGAVYRDDPSLFGRAASNKKAGLQPGCRLPRRRRRVKSSGTAGRTSDRPRGIPHRARPAGPVRGEEGNGG